MPYLEPAASQGSHEIPPSDNDGLIFSCRCESTRPISTLLSCLRQVSQPAHSNGNATLPSTQIANKKQRVQFATVICSSKALTFQVYGVGKQSRARVDLNQGLFSEFFVCEQDVPMLEGEKEGEVERVCGGEFGINLTTVLECLTVLGQASLNRTTLCLSYDAQSAIFKIELLEQSTGNIGAPSSVIISNCAIPGMSVNDDSDEDDDIDGISGLDHAFRSHPLVARARLSSHALLDAWQELTNIGGATSVTISISKMGLELGSTGHSTECQVLLPYQGNVPEIFFSLEGLGEEDALYTWSYPLHSAIAGMRGLEIASETCLSMNVNGMIAIQHLVYENSVGNGEPNYVDFIMGCFENEGGEDDEEPDMSQDNEADGGKEFGDEASFANSQTIHRDQASLSPISRPSQSNDRSPEIPVSTDDTPKIAAESDSDNSQEETEESQESHSENNVLSSLFGTVAEIRAAANRSLERRQERSRRKLNQNDAQRLHNEEKGNIRTVLDESASTSTEEAEFESDDDEKGDSQLSEKQKETQDSPQLMYGDTHLEM